MTEEKETANKENLDKLDDMCEECKKEDESVSQNLIINGYKICNSCKINSVSSAWTLCEAKIINIKISNTLVK